MSENRIPKIIHYCWFGRSPLTNLTLKCIDSWKKYLPEYEIKIWNEDNFDINMIPYTQQAYAAKKYAYVSDYARFWILYHYGGVYFDTDVEVIKPMDEIIQAGSYMGSENIAQPDSKLRVNSGLGIAAIKGLPLYKDILDYYSSLSFVVNGKMKLTTVVEIISNILYSKGLKSVNEIQHVEGVTIYPAEYFASRNVAEFSIPRTNNSYSIHYYVGSWMPKRYRILYKCLSFLPSNWVRFMIRTKKKVFRK